MRPSERLTLGFASFVVLLALVTRPEGGAVRVVAFLAIAAATAGLARHSQDRARGAVRDWLPVAVVLASYLLLQPVIEATVPWRLDAALSAIDDRWFRSLAESWRGALGRPDAFTDAVYAAYLSYYFLPIVAAAVAWKRGPREFEPVVYAVLLSFYLTFVGYLLMPASGPRLDIAEEARLLGGGPISDAARLFLRHAESTTLDAFPSGHTAVTVVAAAVAWPLCTPAAGMALWAWAGAVVFATVYVHAHYVTDVVAGLALALVVMRIARWRRRE